MTVNHQYRDGEYAVLPYVISELQGKVKGMGFKEVKAAVENYFSGIVWSLEKQEWGQMSEHMRNILVLKLMAGANSAPSTPLPPSPTAVTHEKPVASNPTARQGKTKTPEKNITH